MKITIAICKDDDPASRAPNGNGRSESPGCRRDHRSAASGENDPGPRNSRGVGCIEIDLILELPGKSGLWAVEIKRALTAHPGKGFHHAREDLKPKRSFIVHAGNERYPVTKDVEAIGLPKMMSMLQEE
jgi:hypothetical protein